jgi:hypothetical protein
MLFPQCVTDTVQLARWDTVAILDILLEVALFLIPIYLVYGLQMSMKLKATVIAAFACRLP